MGRNKKVTLVTTNFPYGGARANLLRYFCFALAEEGFCVDVMLPTGASYGDKIDHQNKRGGTINGVSYKRLGFIHRPNNYIGKAIDSFIAPWLAFIYLFKKYLNDDLNKIVLYRPAFTKLLYYLIIKVIFRTEIITIVSEFYRKPDQRASFQKIKWYDFYLGINYMVKYVDKFIVLSTFLENYIDDRLDNTKPILIMPNLIDPKKFENNESVGSYKNGKLTIGYVGQPTRKDGILDLIQSFSIINEKYSNTHLLIIGDRANNNSVIPRLKKFAQDQGIDPNNITFTGLVSHKKVPDLLLSCDVLALTRPNGTFAEAGFPTKLGEYFASKKAVLITKVGDMVNYFTDKNEVVFAEPEQINSISSGLEYLLNNNKERKRIANNGFEWMNKNLNYRNQSKRIASFIKK